MNTWSRKAALVYLTGIFLAGAAAGWFGGYRQGRKQGIAPPRREEMSSHMCNRLRERLGLSADQLKQVEPIVAETARQIRTEHVAAFEKVDVFIKQSNERISVFLEPGQKEKLAAMEQERADWLRRMKTPREKSEPR